MPKKASPREQPVQFEDALARLEQIVRELEDGRTGLSDALARYEEGVKCLKQCHDLLKTAERRVELLAGVKEDGTPVTRPFEDENLSIEEKQQARSRRRSQSPQKSGDEAENGDVDVIGGLF